MTSLYALGVALLMLVLPADADHRAHRHPQSYHPSRFICSVALKQGITDLIYIAFALMATG